MDLGSGPNFIAACYAAGACSALLARLSGGHAWGRVAGPLHDGARYTAGLESPVLPLRFTNAAVALRLEAEWWRFERSRRGLAVTVVMQ